MNDNYSILAFCFLAITCIGAVYAVYQLIEKHKLNIVSISVILIGLLFAFYFWGKKNSNSIPPQQENAPIVRTDTIKQVLIREEAIKPATMEVKLAPITETSVTNNNSNPANLPMNLSNSPKTVPPDCETKNYGDAIFESGVDYPLSLRYRLSDISIVSLAKYVSISPKAKGYLYGVPVGIYTYEALNPEGNMFGKARQFDGQFVVTCCTTLTYQLK